MTLQNYSHIALVLDRSGSMSMVKSDAIGGYNEFIRSQQTVPGKATFTLTQFDDKYDVVQEFVDLKDARILDDDNFQPRGLTRLLDAIGKTLNLVGERLDKLPEDQRPEKVVFAILTDGHENDSQEYTEIIIREMIAHQETVYNWQVLFLSSDIRAEADALKYGISPQATLSFSKTGDGMTAAFAGLAEATTLYRVGASTKAMFDPAVKAEQLRQRLKEDKEQKQKK